MSDDYKIPPIIHESHVYFRGDELGQDGTDYGKLAPGFADTLLKLRLAFGKPMHPNSCARSREYNKQVGGHPRSLHVFDNNARGVDGSCAIDIYTKPFGEDYKRELYDLAFQLGWSVGVYRNFLHLDRRSDYTSLPQARFIGGY